MYLVDIVFSYGENIQTLQVKDLSKVYTDLTQSQMYRFAYFIIDVICMNIFLSCFSSSFWVWNAKYNKCNYNSNCHVVITVKIKTEM